MGDTVVCEEGVGGLGEVEGEGEVSLLLICLEMGVVGRGGWDV